MEGPEKLSLVAREKLEQASARDEGSEGLIGFLVYPWVPIAASAMASNGLHRISHR